MHPPDNLWNLPIDRSSLIAVVAPVGLLLLGLLPPLVERWLRQQNCLEPNFRGQTIPQSFGAVILLWSATMLALVACLFPAVRPECGRWLLTVGGFGILGYLDDRRGDKRIKGLRGHFRAFVRERIFTTGLLKAVGGAALALVLGWQLHRHSVPHALLAAALIALSANAMNLLDLRPGRAGAVFLVAAALLLFAAVRERTASALIFVVLPALLVWRRDRRAEVMLGDTGSNLLGASLGCALAELPIPTALQLSVLLLLIALHIAAERVSLTAVIEKHPVLRTLDRLTGVR